MVKTSINCKTKEEFIKVLGIFDKKGWRWSGRDKPLENIYCWDDYEEETCIGYENYFQYTYKEWYLKNGYKVISFEEFLEIESMPEEIVRQEMILNFKEQMK